ncbi:MAG TPA: glycosyltransferase [Pirellulales bacterium]|jgi:glycosyltransferase involved in cell wall biosynthesis
MLLIDSMPVGGAEMMLANLMRRTDRDRFQPWLCCMRELGALGEVLAADIPTYYDLIRHKYDVGVLGRLTRLLRAEHIDALVTVGGGDTMFWGRLAARRAGLPAVLSAVGWTSVPDRIGRLNRLRVLTRSTDGLIAVAESHARHLREVVGFPASKVHIIRNGVDIVRFCPSRQGKAIRRELGIPSDAPLAGMVAPLRPVENHELFLRAAERVRQSLPGAQFLFVGDGPERQRLLALRDKLDLQSVVHFLGSRTDIPEILAALDVFALSSNGDTNPVSILEAMATGKPVVAPRVGSVSEIVEDGRTGYVTPVGDLDSLAARMLEMLSNPVQARTMGEAGRAAAVEHWSLERMVGDYEELIESIYAEKCRKSARSSQAQSGAELATISTGQPGV